MYLGEWRGTTVAIKALNDDYVNMLSHEVLPPIIYIYPTLIYSYISQQPVHYVILGLEFCIFKCVTSRQFVFNLYSNYSNLFRTYYQQMKERRSFGTGKEKSTSYARCVTLMLCYS